MSQSQMVFEVVSNGRSGNEWIAYFEESGHHVPYCTQRVLRSGQFEKAVTKGVTSRLVVIRASELESSRRKTKYIQEEGEARGYLAPSIECAPLLWQIISVEMLIKLVSVKWLIVAHQHVRSVVSDGQSPYVLGVSAKEIAVLGDDPDMHLCSDVGFVFRLP